MSPTKWTAIAGLCLCLLAGCKSGQSAKDEPPTSNPSNQTADDSGADSATRQQETPINLLSEPTEPLIPSDVPAGGTLDRALASEINDFNWVTRNDANVNRLQNYLHSTFAVRDPEAPDSWVPALARKVETNESGTAYTIHLRKDAVWRLPKTLKGKDVYDWVDTNHPVDAEDCKFFFDMLRHSEVEAGAMKAHFRDVEKVNVIDEHTFQIVWGKQLARSRSSTMQAYPLPKHIFTKTRTGEDIPAASLGRRFNDHWSSVHPVGTGPYRLANYEQGDKISLTRNDAYFRTQPPIERLNFHIVHEPAKRLTMLQAGELDMVRLSPGLYHNRIIRAEQNSPFHTTKYEHKAIDQFAYTYLGWNLDSPLFSNPDVRRALTHAFDRKRAIEEVFYGLGRIQIGPFSHDHPANSPQVTPLAFDLDKARRLLERAGWEDSNNDGIRDKQIDGERKEFAFTFSSFVGTEWRRTLKMYREDLRSIGIRMEVEPTAWPTLQQKMYDGDFDAYNGGWALSRAIGPYQIWHSSQADTPKGSNVVGFRSERADELIEHIRTTTDREKRMELARDFHELLHRLQPYTFFRAPELPIVWNTRLKNVTFRSFRPQTLSLPWYFDTSSDESRALDQPSSDNENDDTSSVCQTVTVHKDLEADDTTDWVATYKHDGEGTWHRQSVSESSSQKGTKPPDEVASNEALTFSRAHHHKPGEHEVTQEWRDNPNVKIRVTVEDGNPVRAELDKDKDGDADAIIERQFNERGHKRIVRNDANADGNVDVVRRFSYNADGLRTEMIVDQNADGEPDTTTTYAYDDRGNMIRRTSDIMGDESPEFIVSIDYDDQGRPTRREYDTDADGNPDRATTFTYDCPGPFDPQPRQFP